MIRNCLLAGAALLALPGIAHAQMVTAKRPASIVSALQSKGFKAELTKDDSGDPMINSSSSGTDFIILFYGCENNVECTNVEFYAGFSDTGASMSKMNDWNANHRFSRGYLSDEGAARIESDLDLDEGGMSLALFQDNFTVWTSAMAQFEKHVAKAD